MKLLNGHVSPETAYVVDDYPYGFRLRCKIRYWLEYKAGKGVRFWSQTTNPKRGDVWNKPKSGTYHEFGAAMYLDENDHVQVDGCSRYMSAPELQAWCDTYRGGVPAECLKTLDTWLKVKLAYDAAKAARDAAPATPAASEPVAC